MKEQSFLIAFKATSMESRSKVIQWLKERGAVHVLADVWFFKAPYLMAGDIQLEFEFRQFDGTLVVLRLHQAIDWARKGLTDEANSWISENLGS